MKQSTLVVCLVAAWLIGLAGPAAADLNSLRGAESVSATNQAPEPMKFINDKENIARTFEQQPPLVPHDNDKYTINLKENKCLDCHMKQPGKTEAKSVEMSQSHFVDRTGKKLDHPSSARWFCNQCHVPQIDAQPLIGNSFRAVSTK
jgi:cytochrome c-type protein NapB